MTAEALPVPVQVDVLSFSKLFEDSALPMAVDTYQRGFVWNDDKIRQLADDLAVYQRDADPKPPYYMGTILLHRTKTNRSTSSSTVSSGSRLCACSTSNSKTACPASAR